MVDVILRSETMEARISTIGAELESLRHGRHGEMLWQGDPAYWDKTSPLLFPVIGRVAGDHIRIVGKSYPMPQHGFAQELRFDVVIQAEQSCLLAAEDSSETRAMYPFPFRLEVGYAVSGDTLSIETTVINTGAGMMPASFGYHPGFRWPLEPGLAKSHHEICFPDDDAIIVARPLETLLGPERSRVSLPAGVLALDETEFARGAMIALSPQSRLVHFGSKRGKLSVDVGFEGLANLGIWMRPDGDFLCIEPWQGHADPHGFDGDFFDKPGLDHIGAKSSKSYRLVIRLHDYANGDGGQMA
jgi:galactose mutarotase-like enzyme